MGEKRSAEKFTIVAVNSREVTLQNQEIEQELPKVVNTLDQDRRNVKGLYSPKSDSHLKCFAWS